MPYNYYMIELEGVETTIKNLTYDPYVRGYLKHLKEFYNSRNYKMLSHVLTKLLSWYSSESSDEEESAIFNQFPYTKTKEVLNDLLIESKKLENDEQYGS